MLPKIINQRRTSDTQLVNVDSLLSKLLQPNRSKGNALIHPVLRRSKSANRLRLLNSAISSSSSVSHNSDVLNTSSTKKPSAEVILPKITNQRRTSHTELANVNSHLSKSLYPNQSEQSVLVYRKRSSSACSLAHVPIAQKTKLKNGSIFIDSTFPHNDQSIDYPSSTYKKWLRPNDIVSDDDVNLKWTVYDNPTFTDVRQGQLGNCWFIAALTVVAEIPDLLKHIFITKKISNKGKYELQLFVDICWRTIVVDDHFPCCQNNRLVFSKVFWASRKQLWVPLIEKAYAKVLKSYKELDSGTLSDAFTILTGAPCVIIQFENDCNATWNELKSAKDHGYLMGASCGCNNIDQEEYIKVGLSSTHAYSLLDVREHHDQRIVKLRNPWGTDACTLSPTELFDKNWLNTLCIPLRENDNKSGIFWMPFRVFCKYFNSVQVCKIKYGFKYLSDSITSGISAFNFSLFETSDIRFNLYQSKFRLRTVPNEDLWDLCILLFKSDNNGNVGSYVTGSEHKFKPYVSFDVNLDPGQYICLCVSLYPYVSIIKERPLKFAFGMNSSRTFLIDPIGEYNSKLLTDCFMQFVLHKPVALPNTNVNIRLCYNDKTKKKGFLGDIYLIENNMEDKSVKITFDYSGSNRVTSRDSLLTTDVIPPKHRMILHLILNQNPFEVAGPGSLRTHVSEEPINGIMDPVELIKHSPMIETFLQILHQIRPIDKLNCL